ncbi:IS4 family transposase [Candidatus Poribacteria bacterium]|nr:IS4 family transposase [Candidatus Poribacteria bacterium]
MNIMPHVVCAMQTVLTVVAETAARTTGFIKRYRKLTGATFVQALVFGWLSNPKATLEELSQAAATVGVDMTPQSLDERFTQDGAETLKQVLDAAVEQVVAADAQAVPLMERFNGVYVQDSSWITLPDSLAEIWKGCGGKTEQGTQSSVKVQLRWEMLTGARCHLSLHDGRAHDRIAFATDALPRESLRLADLGYFSLDELKALKDQNVFWLTRVQAMCAIFDTEGNRRELARWLSLQSQTEVELAILLGVQAQLPCRLLAQRVSDEVACRRRRQLRTQARRKGKIPSHTRLKLADWNLLATNVPVEK